MIPAINYSDFYKVDHRRQYPEGTEFVYSNFTPRISRMTRVDSVVVFGIQYFIKDFLLRRFNESFFLKPKHKVIDEYKRRMDNALGKDAISMEHVERLHDLGFLPVEIKALTEGSICPLRVPLLTIVNTHPEFYWVTNFLETLLSNVLWHPITAATIAYEYKKLLTKYADKTSDMSDFVNWQGHDFSMRGSSSFESSLVNGAAHLTSFTGTDTIPAIDWLEHFYKANSDHELIGGSVPATEHSVMCMGGKETEAETYERLITKVYPSGIVSIVSDTWDFWYTLTNIVANLKDKIMARDGKVVIRPDSGDPVKIICGDKESSDVNEQKGAVQILWDIFGGTINSKGYKQLDSHIGLIYGDSITLDRAKAICEQLEANGFASTNVVFGIGSYTYQYVTRDTFGFAMKATWGQINGQPLEIYKDPKTDGGVKKSAKGFLKVNEDMTLSECVSKEDCATGMLKTVFLNGQLVTETSLSEIRTKLNEAVRK